MRSRDQIYFDFSAARREAGRLDDLADALSQSAVDGMENTSRQVGRAWRGESANTYMRKSAALQEQLDRTVSELREIARDIRAIAKAVYDAEMEALRIATQRRSGG